MSADDPALDDKATYFADQLTELVRGVLGPDAPAFSVHNSGTRVRVAPLATDHRSMRIPVHINGERCLSLHVQHFLCWDRANRYLAVDKTHVHLYFEGESDPLLRYEYERSWREPPGAHLHIHAHRDEMAYLLRLAERKGRPRDKLKKRRLPRLSEMHLTVGGHRLRPALEDVLLLLEREFAIDVQPGWDKVIEAHLRDWRILQLKAAVRDAHESAAETLRELGYAVTSPADIEPQAAGSRLYWP
ncbi:hypothetical protein G3I43_36370 [Streptomyces anulatus]|uniref:Uncharacterized protein n=1 Tax=Streptomyces anulatus TaxID=1892 RepID=A0A6G3T380_STRAQ|nr:hypothetical protein [Streptomyces anulatus]